MSDDTKGMVKLFHPRGPQVTLPVTVEPMNYGAMLSNVTAMLDAGWLPFPPGLEEGEEREEIGWVLRLDHEKDGEITPTVLLYSSNPALTYSYLRRYMNSDADVQAFEFASKLKYDQLPAYPGNDHPQRGAGQKTDRFIVQAPKPFGVVWRPNPRYKDAPAGQDTRSLAEKRKRDFVRWVDQKPADAPPAQPEHTPQPMVTPLVSHQEVENLMAALGKNKWHPAWFSKFAGVPGVVQLHQRLYEISMLAIERGLGNPTTPDLPARFLKKLAEFGPEPASLAALTAVQINKGVELLRQLK